MSSPAVLMASRRTISSMSSSSLSRSMMPRCATRSSAAKERFSRTVIGSMSPSVFRNERHADTLLAGLGGTGDRLRLAIDEDLSRGATQNAEQSEQQIALAL